MREILIGYLGRSGGRVELGSEEKKLIFLGFALSVVFGGRNGIINVIAAYIKARRSIVGNDEFGNYRFIIRGGFRAEFTLRDSHKRAFGHLTRFVRGGITFDAVDKIHIILGFRNETAVHIGTVVRRDRSIARASRKAQSHA